jgi:hypothetical protein
MRIPEPKLFFTVMPALVAGIHVLSRIGQGVDGRGNPAMTTEWFETSGTCS